MFCHKCGKEIAGYESFCGSCGANLSIATEQPPAQQAGYTQQPHAQQAGYTQQPHAHHPTGKPAARTGRGSSKKLLVSIVAGVLVVALVITGFATSWFGLGNRQPQGPNGGSPPGTGRPDDSRPSARRAQNPVALAYDGVNGLLSQSSFSFSLTVYSRYGSTVRCDGYVKIGRTVDDLVFYAEVNDGGYRTVAALYQGNLYWGERGYNIYTESIANLFMEAQDNLERQIYYLETDGWYSDDYIRRMTDQYRKFQEFLNISYINSYLRSGYIDRDKVMETLITEYFKVILGYGIFGDYITSDAMLQAFELVEAFIQNELENEEALGRTISGLESRSDRGNTVYTYVLDFYGSVREFFNYLAENYDKYPRLESAAEAMLSDREIADGLTYELGITTVSVPAVIRALRDSALGEISYMDYTGLNVSVAVDSKGVLYELHCAIGRDSLSLEIYDHDSVTIDVNVFDSLIREAIENPYRGGYSDTPVETPGW